MPREIPNFPNEVNPNPIIAIDLRTKEGTVLRFKLPEIQQARVMWAMGKLLASVGAEIDLELPEPEPSRAGEGEMVNTPALKPEGWAKQRTLRNFHWFDSRNVTACGAVVYIPDQWALPNLPDTEKCRKCVVNLGLKEAL